MNSPKHDFYMKRCFDLARLGGREVLTNPLVGAVLVYKDRIIGEGWHKKYGGPHAEVNCVSSVAEADRSFLADSTLYVSLEPCCITGKTPPCTDIILKSGIKKVVISCSDPNPKVDRSKEILEAQGVEWTTGILDEEGQRLLAPFRAHLQKRPYVVLKWAQSQDGYIGKRGQQVWLSSQYSKLLTHKWRSELDAILVGHNTVVTDDPELTVRLVEGPDPLRIVLSREPESLAEFKVIRDDKPTLFLTNSASKPLPPKSSLIWDHEKEDLSVVLAKLFDLGILSILVEGGASTHKAFISAGLWDEARIFKTTKTLGSGIRAVAIRTSPYRVEKFDDDIVEYIARQYNR